MTRKNSIGYQYKQTSQAVKNGDLQYRSLFENARDGIFIIDLDKIIDVNKSSLLQFGCKDKSEMIGKSVVDFSPEYQPDGSLSKDSALKVIKKVLKGKPQLFNWVHKRKDGTEFLAEISLNQIPFMKKIYLAGSIRDITDSKKAEIALVSSEEKFRNLAETAQVAIAILEEPPGNRFLFVNPYWEELTGYSSEEAKKLTPMDLVEPEFHKILTKDTKKGSSSGRESGRNEFKIITKSGEIKWINFTATNIDFEGQKAVLRTGLDITELKINEQKLLQAKEEAQKSESYLDNIINNLGDPVFVKDEQSKFLLVNDPFCTFLGLSRIEIIGKTLAEDIPPKEQEIFLKIDRQVLKGGQENINEETLTIRGGVTKTIITKKTRYIDSNGKKYLIGVIRDVTDRKKAEEVRLETISRLNLAVKTAKLGVWSRDAETDELIWNDRLFEIYGISPDEFESNMNSYFDRLHPDDLDYINGVLESLYEGEPLLDVKFRIIRPDNEIRYIDSSAVPLLVNGRIEKYIGINRDITEQKIAEEKIKESEEKYRTLFEQSVVGIGMGKGKEVVYVNKAMLQMWKYDNLEDFKKVPIIDHYAPEYRELIAYRIKEGLSDKGKNLPPQYQFDILCKDGEIKTVIGHTSYLEIGGDVYAQMIAIDVTERLKAEENTKEALTQLNLAVDTAKIGVWTHDLKTDELVWNDQLFEIYGIDPSETDYSQDMFKKLVHPEDLEYLMSQQEKLEQNIAVSGLNFRIIRPNNEVRHIFGSATPIFDGEGNLIKIMGINLDVTEEKKAEEKLAKANADLIDAVSLLNELKKQLEDQNIYLKKELDLVFNFQEMVYGSAVFSQVLTDLERVAPTDATVLILGESGTGKELLARALHNLSLRKDKPFIKVNCSAIPSELIESELFGHKKGSFTGAVSDKVGKFELADGGTLFLDEIGDLPLAMQPKLLRFLQEGEMEVVGGTTTKSLDVRIVAATNKNLKEEVSKEQFREDLYFRLNVFPIEVPPLKDRKEDIPLLVEHFIDKFGKKYRKNIKYISDSAMQDMRSYSWPGNIRELENLIERSVILSDSETLVLPGFGSKKDKKSKPISSTNLTLNDVQRNHILSILEKTNWKVDGPDGAAKILDLKPSTFRDKMKKLGIKRPKK